ncbi:MAG: uroporphyrinogen decarboxylase family protein [Candidatus Brocadiia bacterium]
MSSRERMVRTLRGEGADRVPVAPWGFGRVDPDSRVGRELLATCDLWVEAPGGGFAFAGAGLESEATTRGSITETILHTPGGDLRSRRQAAETTSAVIEFPCKGAADVEKLLAVPYSPVPTDFSAFSRWRRRYDPQALVCLGVPNAVCWPAQSLSPQDFCLLWAEAPDLMVAMCQAAQERLEPYVEGACRAGVDCFRIIGGEYVTVQLGPRAVPRLLTPFDSRLVDLMHRHGAVAHYHNHGPIMGFLDDLAALGIDSLDPLEAPPWGDCQLGVATRRLGDRVCAVGNLDDMEVVDRLPADAVCAIAARRLEQVASPRFMLGGTASGIYTERAARNFIALARMVAGR